MKVIGAFPKDGLVMRPVLALCRWQGSQLTGLHFCVASEECDNQTGNVALVRLLLIHVFPIKFGIFLPFVACMQTPRRNRFEQEGIGRQG